MNLRLARTAALCAAALALSLAGLRAYLRRPLPCQPPCRRLMPAGRQDGDVFLPQTQPLVIALEVEKAAAKAKTRFTLHYKVMIRNMSDARLSTFDSSLIGFPGQGFRFRVWDPVGRELRQLPPLGEADGVIPYDSDPIPDDLRFIELGPGEAVANAPSLLRPFRYTVRFFETRSNIGLGTAIAKGKVPAQADGWPRPAPGFHVLESYRFEIPGRYRIQAVFDGVQTAYPVFPAWMALPARLCSLLNWLEKLDVDLAPPYIPTTFRLHAESPILEFEVKP